MHDHLTKRQQYYTIFLICLFKLFTDSTNPECFTVPMAVLVEMCYGNNKATTQLPGPSNTLAAGPTVPCPMSLLDSLTVHAKMRWCSLLNIKQNPTFLKLSITWTKIFSPGIASRTQHHFTPGWIWNSRGVAWRGVKQIHGKKLRGSRNEGFENGCDFSHGFATHFVPHANEIAKLCRLHGLVLVRLIPVKIVQTATFETCCFC